MRTLVTWVALGALSLSTACGTGSSEEEEESTADLTGAGPSLPGGGDTEVWDVRNRWLETQTTAAKAAGIAWPANSGLTWEQKYGLWLETAPILKTHDGYRDTIEIRTPYGKKLPAPQLECAEVALMLRPLFAAYYHLPFFIASYDSVERKTYFAGHFGFVDARGRPLTLRDESGRVNAFPKFKQLYADHEAGYRPGAPWPKDTSLRAKSIGSGDENPFLPNEGDRPARTGAYLDEMLLNKRVGHFIYLVLHYFASMDLASSANMYHIKPEATSAGDVLLERFNRDGIGHTIPVLKVDRQLSPGKLAPTIATGSMPRRQPYVDGPLDARHYFTINATGGEGSSWENIPYAKLGGGIRRWRITANIGGKWTNFIPSRHAGIAIADDDLAQIAARPKKFDSEVLAFGSPEEKKLIAITTIRGARERLRTSPASCSARTTREQGFRMLYDALWSLEQKEQSAVDKEYRLLEDYVFRELEYRASKTCCWNSTTSKMADLVLMKAEEDKAAAEREQTCKEPLTFMSHPGSGYKAWKEYAESKGRAGDWLSWSEDEPCPPREADGDRLTELDSPMCE